MRAFLNGFAVVLLGATGAVIASAQNPPPRPATQAPAARQAGEPVLLKPGTARIVGKVVEAGTNTGVAGALVRLTGAALGPPTSMFPNNVPGGARLIAADNQGQFLFVDLPPGAYNVNATAAGYLAGAFGETRIIQIRRSLDLVRSIEITSADGLVPATIQMWKNGGISGRVVDELGEPMVGVPVSVIARVADWSGPVMQVADTVMTDDRGVYHSDITPGDYVVGVLTATTTVPTAAVEGFLDAMREGGAVQQNYMTQVIASGSLLPRGVGTRVGGFMVQQFSALNAPAVPPINAGAGGTMFYPSSFHPSSPFVMTAGVVSIGSGEEKAGVDVAMRRTPARRLSGRVVGPDGPVANITLMLIPPDPSVARTSPAVLIDTPRALTDGNGNFTFIGVASGSYTVRVIRTPTNATQPTLWAASPLAVGDSDVRDAEIRLQPGARISGRIVVENTGPAPDPKQLQMMGIHARPAPGSVGALINWAGLDRADATGRFTTREYIPGPHMAIVSVIPPGFVLKSVTANGQNAVDKTFDLSSSGISDMVVTITDAVTTISGTARDAKGIAMPAATVAVFPVDRTLWRVPGMASRRVQTAAPARDGRYTFRGLPAGEYFVVAVDWPTADFSDGNVLSKLMGSAARVILGDGDNKTQDLQVRVIR